MGREWTLLSPRSVGPWQCETMNSELASIYRRAELRGRSHYFSATDALELVTACRRLQLAVHGIDAFRLTPSSIQPDMVNDLRLPPMDWGTRWQERGWDQAEQYLRSHLGSDFRFEVIHDD